MIFSNKNKKLLNWQQIKEKKKGNKYIRSMTEKAPKVFPTEAELKVLVADELAKLEGLNVNDSHNLR